ncbi:hypothetical protein ASE14_01370 [Agromyces sp. Root81]|uniref:hypothetical protein n=1 Tax=Agromyces sp. Root81 TaxID=1736601 RepID=UPI0006F7D4A8|nr:hypothetical protein [Agromyces sp. Root81]KRC62513.1 hypothetical protein ASE14_01370 [Agromyces sp. Root81]
MFESNIIEAVHAADTLIDEGDQGDAQALLTQALLACPPAGSEVEAIAIAEATGLLIGLDAGLLPGEVLDAHVERMRQLTEDFDGADVVVARVEAELCRFEWVHSQDGVDPIVFVDVLRAASEFAEREQGSEYERVRRAAAEAAFTAQMIRGWLNQDASSIAVALESLALGLTPESDMRMRCIRIDALHAAARLRITQDIDADDAGYLLRAVISEAAECPPARNRYYSATLLLADLALAADVAPAEALIDATAALHSDLVDDADGAWLRCRHLEGLLDRVPLQERGPMAVAEWSRLIDRYATHTDPRVRATMLAQVRYRGGDVEALTAADLQILQYADAAALHDGHPETAAARFRVAALIVEVLGYPDAGTAASATAPRRSLTAAVRFSEDLERRFPGAETDPELSVPMARLVVDRALRLSDLGRREEALSTLSEVRPRFADAPADEVRHIFAQAAYWEGRLNREAGNVAVARSAVDAVVAEFSGDPDPDVRVWAANALFSAWRDPALDPTDADVVFDRFAEIFSNDADPRIRRHDASGRLNRAVRAHGKGAADQAVQALRGLIDDFADDSDADIVDTVRLARENLTVLTLSSASTSPSTSESDARARALRDRLYAADDLYESGRTEEAAREWRALVDATSGTHDHNLAVLGLAALDMWGGYLNDTKQWSELVDVARRAMVSRERLDYRAERMRARAYLRFGIAHGQVGDPQSALAAYEALDQLVAAVTDDEVMTTRQQAVYNRAVLIDDIGDAEAAINAYDHVLAVHAISRDSPSRRLRRVKALRNQARLLDDLNRIAEAASAHRQVLDIASGNPAPDLNERARLSAFSLAECYTRLGEHVSAAQTYAWVRSHTSLGFTKADIRTAARAQKAAERESRRQRTKHR